jgi:hypothetical protein
MLKNDTFAFEGNKSTVVRRTALTYKSGSNFKKFEKRYCTVFQITISQNVDGRTQTIHNLITIIRIYF